MSTMSASLPAAITPRSLLAPMTSAGVSVAIRKTSALFSYDALRIPIGFKAHSLRDLTYPKRTNESMTTTFESALLQPQRLDCLFIDCSCDWQAVITLEIRDSRPCVDAQRPCD